MVGRRMPARTCTRSPASSTSFLAGKRPFADHTNTPSLIQAHLQEAPTPPTQLDPSLPAGFDEAVRRGMAKDPEQRYPSVAAMLADLPNVENPGRTPASAPDQVISFLSAQPARDTAVAPATAPGDRAPAKPRARAEPRLALGGG